MPKPKLGCGAKERRRSYISIGDVLKIFISNLIYNYSPGLSTIKNNVAFTYTINILFS
jgi:hypothetical protein